MGIKKLFACKKFVRYSVSRRYTSADGGKPRDIIPDVSEFFDVAVSSSKPSYAYKLKRGPFDLRLPLPRKMRDVT